MIKSRSDVIGLVHGPLIRIWLRLWGFQANFWFRFGFCLRVCNRASN